MEFLRSWMLSVTSSALAGMLVYILAPKGGTKKAVRTVAAVFFLTAFFLPFGKLAAGDFILPDFALEDSSQAMPPALEEALQSQVLRAREDAIAQTVEAELARRGLPPAEIEFGMDILPEGGIAITVVRIQWSGEYSADTQERGHEATESSDVSARASYGVAGDMCVALERQIRESTGLEVRVELL